TPTSGSSPPWWWRCWPPRSPSRHTPPRPGAYSSPTPGWPCGSPASPAAGATTRPPPTPPPSRRSWPCTVPPGGCLLAPDELQLARLGVAVEEWPQPCLGHRYDEPKVVLQRSGRIIAEGA